MKAVLTTRCGCSREMNVTYPPPPAICVPLNMRETDRGWMGIQPEDPTSPAPQDIRQFNLAPLGTARSPQETAYYYEVLP